MNHETAAKDLRGAALELPRPEWGARRTASGDRPELGEVQMLWPAGPRAIRRVAALLTFVPVAALPSVLLAQPSAPVRVGGEIREPKMTATVNFVLDRHIFSFSGLLASLKDENEYVRAAAARTLGQLRASKAMKERAVSALEKLAIRDESARVREAAVRSLSQLDGRPLPQGMAEERAPGATSGQRVQE